MAREAVFKEVDGINYEIGQLSPSVLLNLIPTIGNIVGGPLGTVINNTQSNNRLRQRLLLDCGISPEEFENLVKLEGSKDYTEDPRVTEFKKLFVEKNTGIDWKELLSELFTKLGDKNVTELIQKILSATYPILDSGKGKTPIGNSAYFDSYLISKNLGVGHIVKVFIAAMEVQYDDFFGENGVLSNIIG